MKNTIKVLGFMTLVAIVGLTMASCASTGGGGVTLEAPQNVKAVESAVITRPYRTVTISWSAVPGADRYRLIDSYGRREVKGTSFTNSNAYQPGRELHFEVIALKGKKGVGPKSERVTIKLSPETQADVTARAELAAKAEAERAAKAAAAEAARVAEAERVAAIENSPAFQQAIGTWRKQKDTITFPNRLQGSFVVDGRTGRITSFTNNSVRVDFGGGRFGILTYNYSISGNRLTVSNYVLGGVAIENMNGVYIKE